MIARTSRPRGEDAHGSDCREASRAHCCGRSANRTKLSALALIVISPESVDRTKRAAIKEVGDDIGGALWFLKQ